VIAKFEVNQRRGGETVREFIERSKLTPEEIAWVQAQPVVGDPSVDRLRTALADEGFEDIELNLCNDWEDLSFTMRVSQRVAAQHSESLLKLWITSFRSAGFPIGYQEIGITDVQGDLVGGRSLTAPLEELGGRWEARQERRAASS